MKVGKVVVGVVLILGLIVVLGGPLVSAKETGNVEVHHHFKSNSQFDIKSYLRHHHRRQIKHGK